MVSSIMETVQKMLSESTQKMSDDLNARMCELRAQDILSTKTTEKIDSALETGSSALPTSTLGSTSASTSLLFYNNLLRSSLEVTLLSFVLVNIHLLISYFSTNLYHPLLYFQQSLLIF